MPIERIEISSSITEIYSIDSSDKRKLNYRIDKDNKQITFFPGRLSFLNEILLEGFSKLPNEFSEFGYIKSGVLYQINRLLTRNDVKKLIVSNSKNNSFRKSNKKYNVVINYQNLRNLKNRLTEIIYEGQTEKRQVADEEFHSMFPKKYKKSVLSSRHRANKVINNLDPSIIEHLTGDDVENIMDFFEVLLKSKYKSSIHRRKLLNSAKTIIDDVSIKTIISDFEKLLTQNPLETKWGSFLQKNLYIVDSKYVNVIPQLSVMLANPRKVDFGLIDYEGCLDIFEIKRPSTPLLSKRRDRGNYYWSSDAVKAIVQAEKYLYNLEKKGPSVQEDIEREINLKVKIQRPRGIVIIGNTSHFDNTMKEDFRVLRTSLKNIEIIPYNELLERITNLADKVYN